MNQCRAGTFYLPLQKKTGTETEISSQRRGAAKAKSSGKPSSHKGRVRGAESAMSASETADPSSCGSGVRGEGRNKSSANDSSSHGSGVRGEGRNKSSANDPSSHGSGVRGEGRNKSSANDPSSHGSGVRGEGRNKSSAKAADSSRKLKLIPRLRPHPLRAVN